MANDQPNAAGNKIKWPIVIAGAVGAGFGVLVLGPLAAMTGLSQPWQASIGGGLGALLGQLVGGLLFRTRG